MRYFKTDASQVQILTITNQDEREHLGDYILSLIHIFITISHNLRKSKILHILW